jgi:ADP-heptose:LPS heptosyltransferase
MARRVLVIHPGALGDVLQAIPALRALGGAETISFCGQPRLGRLLAGTGEVRESLSFDGLGLEALFTEEPPGTRLCEQLARCDEVVSWFGARDARYPARLRALAPVRAIAAPIPPDGSRSTVWQHLIDSVAADGDGTREPHGRTEEVRSRLLEPLSVPARWRDAARERLRRLGISGPFALVHPGAGGRAKLVPPATLARVIAQVAGRAPIRILVHEGPADREATRAMLDRLPASAPRLIDPDLALLAAVASLGRAYLGGDSGVSHLAASAGAPAVLLFPTATRERWAPWSPTARVIGMEDEDAVERASETLAAALSV